MKRVLLLTALIVAVGSIAGAQVAGSVHDLTGSGSAFTGTSGTDQVCVFCHTPHSADATSGPLWNRGASAAGYTMYNSTYSNTIDMTVAATPQGVSAACLSCHDGTVGFDVLINAPTSVSGTYNYTAGGASVGWTFTGGSDFSGGAAPALVGTNLTSEHPISVTYNTADDGDFDTIANAEADGIVFYGGGGNQVECGSCHDPHDNTAVPFLRFANTGSALCRACHTK